MKDKEKNNQVDMLNFEDADTLLTFAADLVDEKNIISFICDYNLAKNILYSAVNNLYEIEFVELNAMDCDEYIATVAYDNQNDRIEVSVESARIEEQYLDTCANLVFVQCNLPWKYDYIAAVGKDSVNDNAEYGFFTVGGCEGCEYAEEEEKKNPLIEEYGKGLNTSYKFDETIEKDGVYTHVYVYSSSKDFTQMIADFITEYYE